MVKWLLLCCWVFLAYATEVRVVLPNPVPVGIEVLGEVQLINVDNKLVNFELPQDPRWQLQLHTNSQNTRTEIINGQRTTTISLALSARFLSLGQLTLGPVVFVTNTGERIASEPVSLLVETPRSDLHGDCVAEVSLQPSSIVPGEPCTLTYRVYLKQGRQDMALTTLDGAPLPSKAIELGTTEESTGTSYTADGTRYLLRVFTRRFTMTTPGSYTIGGQQSYGVEIEDVFNRGVRPVGAVAVRPAILLVEPLPREGRPDDFRGLVGPTSLQVRLERERIRAGEGTRLEIFVANRQADLLAQLDTPEVPGLVFYPQEPANGPDGRTFRFDIVPARPGQYRIPPISVPYFSAESKTYARASGPTLDLQVLPGREQNLVLAGRLPTPQSSQEPQVSALPEPLRQHPYRVPAGFLAWLMAGTSVFGALAALTPRMVRRLIASETALSRALKAAQAQDANALAAALAEACIAAKHDEQRLVLEQLLADIDRARFGGGPLPLDIDQRLRQASRASTVGAKS